MDDEQVQMVPHIAVPPAIRDAVRTDYKATDDAAFLSHVMLLAQVYGHVTVGTPLPPVMLPNAVPQNARFDF